MNTLETKLFNTFFVSLRINLLGMRIQEAQELQGTPRDVGSTTKLGGGTWIEGHLGRVSSNEI